MAKKSEKSKPGKTPLSERMQSTAFREHLTKTLTAWVSDLAKKPIGDLFSKDEGRQVVNSVSLKLLKAQTLLKYTEELAKLIEKKLKSHKGSLGDFLDKASRKALMSVLADDVDLGEGAKDVIGRVMKAPFMEALYTDVLHVTVVGIYKKLNPVFGGLAAKVLETQIKGIIQIFVKVALDRAHAFVVDPIHAGLLTDFIRDIVSITIDEPIALWLMETKATRRKQLHVAIKTAMESAALQESLLALSLAVYDAVYDALKDYTLEEFIHVKDSIKGLVGPVADVFIRELSAPVWQDFLNFEIQTITGKAT